MSLFLTQIALEPVTLTTVTLNSLFIVEERSCALRACEGNLRLLLALHGHGLSHSHHLGLHVALHLRLHHDSLGHSVNWWGSLPGLLLHHRLLIHGLLLHWLLHLLLLRIHLLLLLLLLNRSSLRSNRPFFDDFIRCPVT